MTETTTGRPLPLRLYKGGHKHDDPNVCLIEGADRYAGGPGDDHTARVSPVIAAYCRVANDTLDDEPRQRLIHLIPLLITTGGSSIEVEVARAFLLVDWSIRRIMPIWLDAVGFADDAAKLRALSPVRDAQDAARAARADLAARAALAARADLADLAEAITTEIIAAIEAACALREVQP